MELTRVLLKKQIDERIDGLFAIERELRAMLDRKLAPLGVTYAQYAMLRFIGEPRGAVTSGPDNVVRATDVTDYFGFALRTVTVTVNRLVNAGLVRRRKSPSDGRVQELLLTTKGQKLLDEARVPFRQTTEIFKDLPGSHWERLWHTIPSILLVIAKQNKRDERVQRGKRG
ncbi:MarR family transcriptional regulator [Pseudoxanthomonas sp.]|uniref:MarR family winged helix-turn-helix transcriptional regulator n=1 Tax=Pseudoxanthomonas sp. TaxID=1871049 RepID=UPI0025CC4A94|nr:MarR family transcriptional regulator [Pseudoxanthomonas sp.]